MENLILPVAVIAIVVIGALSAYVADDPSRKERAWKIFTLTLVTVVLTVTLSILFGGVLYGCARAEEEGVVVEYTPDEYLIEAAGENEILIKVSYEGKWLSLYWDTIDESFKPTKIWVRIVDGFCVEADYVEEEPEPIGFPPFCFIGALVAPVANKSKKYKLAQTMPPDLYLPCKVWEIQVSIVYYVNNNRSFNTVALDPITIKALKSNKVQDVAEAYCETIGKALDLLNRATAKEVPAYIVAYVPAYKQMAVIACNYCGFLEYWRNTAISDKVSAANALLRRDIQMIPESAEHKPISNKPSIARTPATEVKIISDKDDPFVQVVEVKYSDYDDKTFTFRCRQAHTPGDYVCVFTKRAGEATKTYKNVKVVKYTVMKESEVKALAKSLGYSDISEVYCDKAVDIPEAWSNWKDPADDPELYAPTEEEIADFEAMRETMLGSGYRDF